MRAAVTIAKGVDGVQFSHVMAARAQKAFRGNRVGQHSFANKIGEQARQARDDPFGKCEIELSRASDIGPFAAFARSPRINILKNMAMNCLKMRLRVQIAGLGNVPLLQPAGMSCHIHLEPSQLRADPDDVPEIL